MRDLFRRDLRTGAVQRLTARPDGSRTVRNSGDDAAVSAGNRLVFFRSEDPGLVPNAAHGGPELYVRDLSTGRIALPTEGMDGSADSDTACGTAAHSRGPVVVEEVASSLVFAGSPALDVLADAHVGAVVSVPITLPDGTLIGVVSVHHHQPTVWPGGQRRILDSLTRADPRRRVCGPACREGARTA
ncbi:GAF domain-containing protein [Streptomyces sp. A5-4]|uniref:GAF domain-containing protein n=1 Tax=Streptomyces sp. A5-4 TaxID=3384771 RepID=UPI003DA889CE